MREKFSRTHQANTPSTMAGTKRKADEDASPADAAAADAAKDATTTESTEPQAPPPTTTQEGGSSQVTEMLAEIASLKQSVEAWKAAFVEELGLGGKGDEDEDGAFESAAIGEALRSIRRENEGLTSSLLQTQAKLDEARKEAAYAASSLAPAARAIDKVLMDPGLARQFRHMESEVDQGREMMKEMQDDLVAVTYTADNYEKKQQVERLRTLERVSHSNPPVATSPAIPSLPPARTPSHPLDLSILSTHIASSHCITSGER